MLLIECNQRSGTMNAQSWLGAQVQARKFNQSCPTKRRMKTGNFDEKQYGLCALIDFFLAVRIKFSVKFSISICWDPLCKNVHVKKYDAMTILIIWNDDMRLYLHHWTRIQVASHSIFSKWHSTVIGNGQYKENQWTCYLFFIYAKGNWLELINECNF